MTEQKQPTGMDDLAAGFISFVLLGGGVALATYLVCLFGFGWRSGISAAVAVGSGTVAGCFGGFTKAGRALGDALWTVVRELSNWT
ncbi:MAG: hypothetical protein R3C13_07935 [Hyphomonas sp.]|uniref:hypothetical protein n=1 Tax=Hyphomonas sp. TaxID=87 RepID=UPI003527FAA9